MATVTLAVLKTRARQRADMEDSEFISDSELLSYINSSYAELYDLLVASYEDYHVGNPVEFTISSGNTYTLPSDFYKLRAIDYKVDGSNYAAMRRFVFADRNSNERSRTVDTEMKYRIVGNKIYIEPSSNANGDYRIWYTPSITLLSTDSDTIDGINGWEEYVVVDAAIKMLNKEESDTRHLDMEKQSLMQRIEKMSQNRDDAAPDTITDMSAYGFNREF